MFTAYVNNIKRISLCMIVLKPLFVRWFKL